MSEEPTPLRHVCTVSKTSQLVAQCTQSPQHIPTYLPTQTHETHVPSNYTQYVVYTTLHYEWLTSPVGVGLAGIPL